MRTPLSLSYALVLSLILSSCSSGLGDRKKLGRQSSATSSGGSTTSGSGNIDPATQAAEKTRLVAEGKKSVENLGNLKAQLEDLDKKLSQPDADLKKPEEILASLSLIYNNNVLKERLERNLRKLLKLLLIQEYLII